MVGQPWLYKVSKYFHLRHIEEFREESVEAIFAHHSLTQFGRQSSFYKAAEIGEDQILCFATKQRWSIGSLEVAVYFTKRSHLP